MRAERSKIPEDSVGGLKWAPQARISGLIFDERDRQDRKWGEQNHDDLTWLSVFVEEVGEVAKECIPAGVGGSVYDADLERELIHALAVGVAWLEARDRRRKKTNA